MKKEAPRMMHMGIARALLYKSVMCDGLTGKDLGLPDCSKDEVLQAIKDDPREVICSCDCKKDSRGACTGEPA